MFIKVFEVTDKSSGQIIADDLKSVLEDYKLININDDN